MPRMVAGFSLLALMFTFIAGFSAPAAAEFFGCDDQHPARSASYRASTFARAPYTHHFAAQSAHTRHAGATYVGVRRSWTDRSRW